MGQINSICVYCGSNVGRREDYLAAAVDLAEVLVAQNIRLVYGGAMVGLMGAVADKVLALGGEVVGVIPKALAHKELLHPNLSQLYVTDSMHQRKMQMANLADGFIALPGGIGTLEELFEIWTWGQLGFHQKPCGLLNVAGYYNGLISFLDQVTSEQFMQPLHRDMLLVADQPKQLLDSLQCYQPPVVKRWLSQDNL